MGKQIGSANMDEKKIEYRIFAGVFHDNDHGVRQFHSNTYIKSFDDFESAFEYYKNFDLEIAYRIAKNINMDVMENGSTFKRLERIEFGDDVASVDVVSFEEYNDYDN